jgi:hypothetical protein
MTISEKRALLCVGGPIIFLCLIVVAWAGYKAKGNENLPIQVFHGRVADCKFRNYGGGGQRRIGVDLIKNEFVAKATFNPYKKSDELKIGILKEFCENKKIIKVYYRRYKTVWFMEERNFWYKIGLSNGQEIEAE